MTDLRYLEKHREHEDAGWEDVLIGMVMILAVCAGLWLFWQLCPGCKTVDEVLQIDAQEKKVMAELYHPRIHVMRLEREAAE